MNTLNTLSNTASSKNQDTEKYLAQKGDELTETKDRLFTEFRSLLSDGEELLKTTAGLSGDALNVARQKFERKWAQAKIKLDEAQAYAVTHGRQIAKATDEYVHESPWTAIGMAAGVGVVIGLLLSRRSSE